MMSSVFIVACSGPGALPAIYRSIAISNLCAAIGGVITLALLYDSIRMRRYRFTLAVAVFLLLIHPAWTVDAFGGDCGGQKREAAYIFTGIYAALLVYQYLVSNLSSNPDGKP